MTQRINLMLLAWALATTLALALVFVDNRVLAGVIDSRASEAYVTRQDFTKLVGACEALARVNRDDQDLLLRAAIIMEDIDGQRRWNEKAVGDGAREVRRVSRRSDKRGSRRGGP